MTDKKTHQEQLEETVKMVNEKGIMMSTRQLSPSQLKKMEDYKKAHTPIVLTDKIGRNAPCPCNSGKKFKKCHLLIEEANHVKQS